MCRIAPSRLGIHPQRSVNSAPPDAGEDRSNLEPGAIKRTIWLASRLCMGRGMLCHSVDGSGTRRIVLVWIAAQGEDTIGDAGDLFHDRPCVIRRIAEISLT